jgi:hypothetical protein
MITDSVFSTIEQAKGPIAFEQIVERVQRQSPEIGRNEIASELGGLIRKQRVFLNQERTGFCATHSRRDSRRFLERAVATAMPESRVQFHE